MIRRISIAFLAIIYLVVAVGVTISGHFCGGYLESYSFSIVSDEHDCCGGMPMDENCCENVQVTIKSSEDHFGADILKVEPSALLIYVTAFETDYFVANTRDAVFSRILHPPPKISKCPVHIKNRILLI